ncbi:hypothetical protein QJS04_geneDACA017266 [Acorus gramineus]|uniref:Uncharacterized protein n=1 Tax=Acorus gramineus TaxID=55184 RepID=A0AAV9A2W2_ACOGR|nr:hypothetical protein QJS04_geneDACA017266 [Acorus gramineus]
MKKLLEFGRRAMFVIRVMSGYEERRIRSYRLHLEKRLQEAQQRRAALRKVPEHVILSEMRRMVGEMQALNQKLEEAEAAIGEYFKPIDQNVDMIMDMQLKREKDQMMDIFKATQSGELLAQAEAEMRRKASSTSTNQQSQATDSVDAVDQQTQAK